jgi:DNA-binding NarL/FixJ family response regulator
MMKKIRLLLADDNSHLLQLLACLLSEEHRIVGTVSDGRALITAAAELRPDIVISDIDMPTVNGLEAARQLRELLPRTKVILMSGHDDSEHVASAVASGACAFVSKGKAGDLRATFNAIIRNVLAQPTSEELVGHGMAKHEGFRSVGNGVR